MGELGVSGDGNMRDWVGGGWRGRILKEMTGREEAFQNQIETWCKRNSLKFIRMTPAQIFSNGGCVA